jgi:hypothetical protein
VNWLARARDWAIILLALQGAVLILLSGAAAIAVLRGLRWLMPRQRLWLFRIRLGVWKGARLVTSAVELVRSPFLWLRAVAAGLERTLAVLNRR